MRQTLIRRCEAGLVFDRVEGADPVDRLLGDRGLLADPVVVELASAMRPARHFGDCGIGDLPFAGAARFVERLEPGIAVSLQETGEAREVLGRVFPAPVWAVEVSGCRRRRATERPIVTDIDPQPPGFGSSEPRRKHRDCRVVAMDLLGGEDMVADPIDDRLQQPDRLADPVAQGRAVEVEAVARVNLALSIQGQMIGIFRHQQMRQHAGGGAPARCRQGRCRRLGDRVAAPAGIFRPDMADHPEPAGDIVEDLGDVFTKTSHVAAAVRAGAGTIVRRFVHDLLTRQMIRQWLALWSLAFTDRQRPIFGGSLADLFGFAGFQLLEPQFELLDLPGQPLRGATKLHPPQLGDLEFQLLDFQGAQLDGELCRLQLGGRRRQFALAGERKSPQRVGIGGQIGRDQRHTALVSNATSAHKNRPRIPDPSNQHGSRRPWWCYGPPPIHRLDQ